MGLTSISTTNIKKNLVLYFNNIQNKVYYFNNITYILDQK